MQWDFGYEEEGKLGRPYDTGLLRRLYTYAVPHRSRVFLAFVLTLLVTLLELTSPYLTKLAIDRHIVAGWYRVTLDPLRPEERKAFLDRYGSLMEEGGKEAPWVLPQASLTRVDPKEVARLKALGALSPETWYRAPRGVLPEKVLQNLSRPPVALADGTLLIAHGALQELPGETRLELRRGDIQGVALLALVFLLAVGLSFALNYWESMLLELTGQRMMQTIRTELFQKILAQPVAFFDRQPVGRLVTRVTNDVENLNEMFKSVLVTLFKDLFLLAGILTALFFLNWGLALLCSLFLPVIFGLAFLFSTHARQAFRELRTTVAKINAFLQERIPGMRIIQLFRTEPFQRWQFGEINEENYRAGMKQIRVFALFMPLMELFASVASALLIWYGGGKVVQEQLSLGSLVAFLGYMQMFFKPIRDISEKYNIMQLAMASLERIFEVMDREEGTPPALEPYRPALCRGHLAFRDVSFAYEKGRPVLKRIGFEVRPGETVALVGPTGSGKSTLVTLAERFYDPAEGEVSLDGVDLRAWDPGALHHALGLCLQEVFLFSGTLSENISLGDPAIDKGRIVAAARLANALSFISRLPKGLEEELGEGGMTLSAGERQLLSFARALAHEPRVLILDEATSSVDPETERLIQEAIATMAAGRTTLVVAHRLSTVRKADRILVVHKGEILEEGDHATLLAKHGIYAKLLQRDGLVDRRG